MDYLGYGFFQEDVQITEFEEFKEYISSHPDNPDIQRIIRGHLNQNGKSTLIHFREPEVAKSDNKE